MSDHENEEELRAFEARLAALQPRKPAALPTVAGGMHGVARAARGCTNPAGHRFVCLYCGADAPSRAKRSAWRSPRVYVGVAAAGIAAAIVIMLMTPPTPPEFRFLGGNGHTAAPVQEDAWLSTALQADARRHGIDWNERAASPHFAGATPRETPATNHELLRRFLADPVAGG